MAEVFQTVYQGNGGRVDIGSTYTQNIDNNTSTITVKAYVVKTNSSYYSYGLSPQNFTLTVNGTATTIGWTFDFRNMTTDVRYLIMTTTRTVTHNADGSIGNVSTSVYCATGTDGLGTISGSGSIALATIPRASMPSLGVLDNDIGNIITIYTNRASTSFTHTISYTFGSASGTLATGVTTSYSWTTPASLANQIPTSVSGSGNITVKTYSGTTLIGTNSIGFDITVPNTASYQPTASTPSKAISGTGRDSVIAKYVQNISKVVTSFTATAQGGATINSSSINVKHSTNANSMTISGTSGTSGVLTLGGTYTITTTTTDSRGRSKTSSTTFVVETYAIPKITTYTAIRNATPSTTVNNNAVGTYTYMAGSNPLSVNISKKLTTVATYTSLNTTAGTTSGTFTNTYVSTLNTDSLSYHFKLVISDSFGNTATSVLTVSTASIALSIKSDVGIGVGKVWEQGALDVGGVTYFNGIVNHKNGTAVMQTNMGSYYNSSPTNTGAIWIDIGTQNIMFNTKINIRSYNYLANIEAGGYTYVATNRWHSIHVTGSSSNGALNVRFATATTTVGSNRYIVIGDSNTVWGGYLAVVVEEATVGLGVGFTSPFTITVSASYPTNINSTVNVAGANYSSGTLNIGGPSVSETGVNLRSGVKLAKIFYRESDHHFGFYLQNSTNLAIRLRYNGTDWNVEGGANLTINGQRVITVVDNAYGSNANGSYLKFEDGTLICWGQEIYTYVNTSWYHGTWTYPHAFIATPPHVSGNRTAESFNNYYIDGAALGLAGHTTSCYGRLFSSSSSMPSGLSPLIRMMAIGRWK